MSRYISTCVYWFFISYSISYIQIIYHADIFVFVADLNEKDMQKQERVDSFNFLVA